MRGKLLYRRALAYVGLKQLDRAVADLEDASLKSDKVGRSGAVPTPAPLSRNSTFGILLIS